LLFSSSGSDNIAAGWNTLVYCTADRSRKEKRFENSPVLRNDNHFRL